MPLLLFETVNWIIKMIISLDHFSQFHFFNKIIVTNLGLVRMYAVPLQKVVKALTQRGSMDATTFIDGCNYMLSFKFLH